MEKVNEEKRAEFKYDDNKLLLAQFVSGGTSWAGAQIGGWLGGPHGANVGAQAGKGLGLISTIFILQWLKQKGEKKKTQ